MFDPLATIPPVLLTTTEIAGLLRVTPETFLRTRLAREAEGFPRPFCGGRGRGGYLYLAAEIDGYFRRQAPGGGGHRPASGAADPELRARAERLARRPAAPQRPRLTIVS
jgi:hypothetical protein